MGVATATYSIRTYLQIFWNYIEVYLTFFARWVFPFNPRPAGGGGVWTPPPHTPRFIKDSENTAALRAAGFSPTWPPMFSATFLKISTQVHARSGQVKWPNYKITFKPRHGYNVLGKVMKLSEMIRSSVPAKRIVMFMFIHVIANRAMPHWQAKSNQ